MRKKIADLCKRLLVLVVVIATVVGCSQRNERSVKISDYLYEVWVQDYVLDSLIMRHDPTSLSVGCSQMRKGRYVGRNLDWKINKQVTFIVHTSTGKDRYASVGVACCSPDFTTDALVKGIDDAMYEKLPLCVVDGINTCGVYVAVNNAPTGETSWDTAKWCHPYYGLGAHFTNPQSDKTYADFYLVRFVLDKASSVEAAIELIKEVNWYETVKNPETQKSQSLHWLVADKSKTAVIEFLDNKMEYVISEDIQSPSYATIMTNFNNVLKKAGMIQTHGCGYERFDILDSCYSSVDSQRGMKEVMQKVWYSRAYIEDLRSPEFYFSDYEGFKSSKTAKEYTAYDLYRSPQIREDSVFMSVVDEAKRAFCDSALWYRDDTPLWHTNHTVVYDIEEKGLSILMHEGRGNKQQEWHTAQL